MTVRGTIVVGVNGAQEGDAALRWAGAEAGRRHLSVLLVHAWAVYPVAEGWPMPLEGIREAEAQVLVEAEERFRSWAPGVETHTRLVEGRADVALAEASQDAALLVVGRHAGSSAWLGPVLGHLTTHAGCPVVAIPSKTTEGAQVVVGVDGSEVSQDAVAFAFAEASLLQAPLVAVLAVPPPFDAYFPTDVELERIRDRGRRYLSESLAGLCERYPDVHVTESVSLDAPLPALRQAAAGAALLVVGSHGRGALMRAALGSVSGSLLRSADCPVVVVRPRHEDAEQAPLQANDVPWLPIPIL